MKDILLVVLAVLFAVTMAAALCLQMADFRPMADLFMAASLMFGVLLAISMVVAWTQFNSKSNNK